MKAPAADAAATTSLSPATSAQAGATLQGAGGAFEGTFDLVVTAPDEGGQSRDELFHFVCRGPKVRWDIDNGYGFRVYDQAAGTFSTVFPREHAVSVLRESSLVADAGTSPAGWGFEKFDIGAVATEPCERVHVTAGKAAAGEACIAQGFPSIPLELISPALGQAVPFAPALRAQGRFALAATLTQAREDAGARRPGQRAMPTAPIRVIVRSIERRTVREDEVAVPPFPATQGTSLLPPPRPKR